jgi:hypothetical protein
MVMSLLALFICVLSVHFFPEPFWVKNLCNPSTEALLFCKTITMGICCFCTLIRVRNRVSKACAILSDRFLQTREEEIIPPIWSLFLK